MAQHNNFKKDVDMLAEAYGSMHQTKEVVVESTDAPNPVEDNGEAAFKGGNIEHDWATHIQAPQFEGFKKILHHSLTEEGVVEEYYIEYNGKLVGILAEDITVFEGVGHDEEVPAKKKKKKKSEDGESEDGEREDDQYQTAPDDEESEEEALSESRHPKSPKHGARPKLIGVPILK